MKIIYVINTNLSISSYNIFAINIICNVETMRSEGWPLIKTQLT